MFTKITLAAALVAATSIVSLATGSESTYGKLYSAPVNLSSLSTGVITGRPGEIDQYDRAASPSAGGVG